MTSRAVATVLLVTAATLVSASASRATHSFYQREYWDTNNDGVPNATIPYWTVDTVGDWTDLAVSKAAAAATTWSTYTDWKPSVTRYAGQQTLDPRQRRLYLGSDTPCTTFPLDSNMNAVTNLIDFESYAANQPVPGAPAHRRILVQCIAFNSHIGGGHKRFSFLDGMPPSTHPTDFQSVAAHEFGHAGGLNDLCGVSGCATPVCPLDPDVWTMCTGIPVSLIYYRRTLDETHDVAAVNLNY